jgi:hypothetical protein
MTSEINDFVNRHAIQPMNAKSEEVYSEFEQLNGRLDLCSQQADVLSARDAWLCKLGEIYCRRLASRCAYFSTSIDTFKEELTTFLTGVQDMFFEKDPAGFSQWLSKWNSFPVATDVDNPNAQLMAAMAEDLGVEDVFLRKQWPPSEPEAEAQAPSVDPTPVVQQVTSLTELNQDPVMQNFLNTLVSQVGIEGITGSDLQKMIEQCQGNDLEVRVQNLDILAPDKITPGQIQMKSYRCPEQSPFWRVELDIVSPIKSGHWTMEQVDDAMLNTIQNDLVEMAASTMPEASHMDETFHPDSRPQSPTIEKVELAEPQPLLLLPASPTENAQTYAEALAQASKDFLQE